SRSPSKTTTPAIPRKSTAQTTSAVRIPLFQQAALLHQIPVEALRLLQPLHELGSRLPGGLERSLLQVVLELGRLVHLLQQVLVEGDRVGRHLRRSEDPPQHQVL